MKIIWSPLAIDRASEIVDYIARDKPSAAENWINTVFSKVEQLKSSPEIGRIVPEIKNNQFRELIYGNYRSNKVLSHHLVPSKQRLHKDFFCGALLNNQCDF